MNKITNVLLSTLILLQPFGIDFVVFANNNVRNATEASFAFNTNPSQKGIVSFTFDDGDYSVFNKALPLFEKYNLPATAYIPTQFVGKLWQLNINDYNMNEKTKNNRYMNWDELHTLENAGWEIGDHSETHPDFEKLDQNKALEELAGSKQALTDHGFTGVSFATPFGSYHKENIPLMARLFRTHRGYWEREQMNHIGDRNNLSLNLKAVERATPLADVKAWIDEAAQQGKWLILVFHIIDDSPGKTNEFAFSYPTANLEQLVQKAKQLSDEQKIKVMTVENASLPQGKTIFSDSVSDSSLTENWTITTNSPHAGLPVVSIDNDNNGAFPEAQTSMKIQGNSTGFKLTSKEIEVTNPGSLIEVGLYLNKLHFEAESIQIILVQHLEDGTIYRVPLKSLNSKSYLPVNSLTLQNHLLSTTVEVQLEIRVEGPSQGTLYLDEFRIGELEPN